MKSVMTHQFSQIPSTEIPRSTFNQPHGHKTTFDAGYLIPFYADEALPGDTFNLNASLFGRIATPIYPLMDNLHMDVFYFAVPNRLLWDNWQKFMGEQTNPADSIDFVVPEVIAPVGGFASGSLGDYFGMPTLIASLRCSALWHRAYNLIYSEWFRDQNLQNSPVLSTADTAQNDTDFPLRRRGKRHDYFTSCLPWPQKGPGIEMPVGGQAPVVGLGKYNQVWQTGPFNAYETGTVAQVPYAKYQTLDPANNDRIFLVEEDVGTLAGHPAIYADLSSASAVTINALRQAFQLQKLLERDARGGTRYTELIRAHFGVVSPDARLQRPEYLGGTSSPVQFMPVASTVKEATHPQGHLAAFGTMSVPHSGFTKSFTEHSIIIGLVSVRADLTYQQGLPRMFSRSTKYDFFWPALSHIGEQAVLQKEIFCDNTADDELVFGYQERWAEYRYYPSKITGKFRSNDPLTLDAWHLSQDFATAPTLSDTFIKETPPMTRVIAVPTEPHFLFDSYIQCKKARPMPLYSVPGLIDHF